MDMLKAREQLDMIQISNFANFKKSARQKIHMSLQRRAYPRTFKEYNEKEQTTEQAFDQVRNLFNGK